MVQRSEAVEQTKPRRQIPWRDIGAVLKAMAIGTAVVAGVVVALYLPYLAIKDITTLDPLPEGVEQRDRTTFYVPYTALAKDSDHSKPERLCYRLEGEDEVFDPLWVPVVKKQSEGLLVTCEFGE